MRTPWVCLFGGIALALTFNAGLAAQQNQKPKKAKQTHDRGIDDRSADLVPVERNTNGLVITHRADGSTMAKLDDSFDEATVAVRNDDGTYSYVCVHGLPIASQQVKSGQLEKAVKADASKLEVK